MDFVTRGDAIIRYTDGDICLEDLRYNVCMSVYRCCTATCIYRMPNCHRMPLLNILSDIKVWIAVAIILALIFGFGSPDASTIMMIALIAQMAVALDGIQFSRHDFGDYKKPIVLNLLCCFIICTGFTLVTGLLFIDNQALWTGWVMLSAVPCAISVVPSALFLRADPKLAVLSLAVIYVVAIALTPIITHTLIGNSVNPLEVLRYILMFILIPFILTIPLKRLHLKQAPKTVFINLMMFILVFVGLGSRQEFVFSRSEEHTSDSSHSGESRMPSSA